MVVATTARTVSSRRPGATWSRNVFAALVRSRFLRCGTRKSGTVVATRTSRDCGFVSLHAKPDVRGRGDNFAGVGIVVSFAHVGAVRRLRDHRIPAASDLGRRTMACAHTWRTVVSISRDGTTVVGAARKARAGNIHQLKPSSVRSARARRTSLHRRVQKHNGAPNFGAPLKDL